MEDGAVTKEQQYAALLQQRTDITKRRTPSSFEECPKELSLPEAQYYLDRVIEELPSHSKVLILIKGQYEQRLHSALVDSKQSLTTPPQGSGSVSLAAGGIPQHYDIIQEYTSTIARLDGEISVLLAENERWATSEL